jgi:hypothetical protein
LKEALLARVTKNATSFGGTQSFAKRRCMEKKRLCWQGLQNMQRPLAVHKALQRDVAWKRDVAGKGGFLNRIVL